jgi:hypothetical protein
MDKRTYNSKENYLQFYFQVEKSWKGITGIKAQIKVGSPLCVVSGFSGFSEPISISLISED